MVYKESHLIRTWSSDNKNNMTKQRVCGVGHFQNWKERGVVWALAITGSTLSSCLHWPHQHVNALAKELETEEKGKSTEEGKGGFRVKGPTPSCWLLTNQEGSSAVLEATEGEERRRIAWKVGGWVDCKADPQGQLSRGRRYCSQHSASHLQGSGKGAPEHS